MEKTYAVRTESAGENNGFLCWIDINGNPVICQPNAPHLANQGNFSTEADALAWGEEHVAQLQAENAAALAAAALKEEREAAQHAANLAMVALLERLTNSSS
jgi:hypothetical protein